MTRFAAVIIATGVMSLLLIPLRAQGAPFRFRYSTAPEQVRVVLDLPGSATFTDTSTPRQLQFAVDLPLEAPLPAVTITDPVVASACLTPVDGKAQLTITMHKARKYSAFLLPPTDGRGDRLVVDIVKRFRTEETRALSPAITYTRLEQQNDDRYLAAHFVEVNTADPRVRLGVAAAQGERERVAAMVERTGAVCGVNAGYFREGTRPVGLLKVDGQVLMLPIWRRTAVAFPRAGAPVFGNPQGVWRLTLPDGATRDFPDWLDASVCTPPPPSVVYAGTLFTRVPANPGGLTVLLRAGRVAARTTDLLPLAPGDFALRLTGDDAVALDPVLVQDAAVTLTPVLAPSWDEFLHAVGAGPRLLRDGVVAITGQEERFKADITSGRPARTALGVTARGGLVLLVVEAPCVYGGGASLRELAELLKARGAVDAMNLDGGGSSALAIGDSTVNCPPGAWVRPVASGILVFDDRVTPPAPPMPAPGVPPVTPTDPAPPEAEAGP